VGTVGPSAWNNAPAYEVVGPYRFGARERIVVTLSGRCDMTAVNDDRHTEEWREAHKRVTTRRDFASHVVTYVVINGFLILLWALTGAGYFWPAWILAGWGVGLVLHAWDAFVRKPVTDADVEAELHRMRRTG
jgi:2TM domain-containing protein